MKKLLIKDRMVFVYVLTNQEHRVYMVALMGQLQYRVLNRHWSNTSVSKAKRTFMGDIDVGIVVNRLVKHDILVRAPNMKFLPGKNAHAVQSL